MIIEVPTMLTIKETAARTGLAEHYVRKCCINNKITYIRCGKRILVNLEKLVEFLNSGDGNETNGIPGKHHYDKHVR